MKAFQPFMGSDQDVEPKDDSEKSALQALYGTVPSGRYGHTACLEERTGSIYVFGGKTDLDCACDNGLFRFDIKRSRWEQVKPWYTSKTVPQARWGHSAVIQAKSSRMFMFGGQTRHDGTIRYLNDLWVLDLFDHVWRQIAFVEHPSPALAPLPGQTIMYDGHSKQEDGDEEDHHIERDILLSRQPVVARSDFKISERAFHCVWIGGETRDELYIAGGENGQGPLTDCHRIRLPQWRTIRSVRSKMRWFAQSGEFGDCEIIVEGERAKT